MDDAEIFLENFSEISSSVEDVVGKVDIKKEGKENCVKPIIFVSYKDELKQSAIEELSSLTLMKMADFVEVSHCRRAIKDIVVTFPSHFSDLHRRATRDIDVVSGFKHTTAAIVCGLVKNSRVVGKEVVLKFDHGGGTLLSHRAVEAGIFRVQVTAGNTLLLCISFDSRMVNQYVKEFTGKDKDINASTVILKVHRLLLDDYSDRKELYRNKVVQAAVLNGKKDEQVQVLIRLNVSSLLCDLGTTEQLPEGKKVRIKDDNLSGKLDFCGTVHASKSVYEILMCCKNKVFASDQELQKLCNDAIITIETTELTARQLSDFQAAILIYAILQTTWRNVLGNMFSNLGLAFTMNGDFFVLLKVCEITEFSDLDKCLLIDFSNCGQTLLLHLAFQETVNLVSILGEFLMAGLHIHTGFIYIYVNAVVCCASEPEMAGLQDAELQNLPVLWRFVKIGEIGNEVQIFLLELHNSVICSATQMVADVPTKVNT